MTQPRKHRHADMIRRWLDDDSLEVEWKESSGHWVFLYDDAITWDEGNEYRFKPKMIRCGDLEFPEPMRVAPKDGGQSWAVYVNTRYNTWRSDESDYIALKEGRVHTTQDAAAQHARALIALTESKS